MEHQFEADEPLRPGEIIMYYSPTKVPDQWSLRATQILSCRQPTGAFEDAPLDLENGVFLPAEHNIVRKGVFNSEGGDLVYNPCMFLRPIEEFCIQEGSISEDVAHGLAGFRNRVNRVGTAFDLIRGTMEQAVVDAYNDNHSDASDESVTDESASSKESIKKRKSIHEKTTIFTAKTTTKGGNLASGVHSRPNEIRTERRKTGAAIARGTNITASSSDHPRTVAGRPSSTAAAVGRTAATKGRSSTARRVSEAQSVASQSCAVGGGRASSARGGRTTVGKATLLASSGRNKHSTTAAVTAQPIKKRKSIHEKTTIFTAKTKTKGGNLACGVYSRPNEIRTERRKTGAAVARGTNITASSSDHPRTVAGRRNKHSTNAAVTALPGLAESESLRSVPSLTDEMETRVIARARRRCKNLLSWKYRTTQMPDADSRREFLRLHPDPESNFVISVRDKTNLKEFRQRFNSNQVRLNDELQWVIQEQEPDDAMV